MKIETARILLLLIPFLVLSQEANWVFRYNGPAQSDDRANSVVYGADSNIYAAGYSTGIGTNKDFTVISLNLGGDTNWVYRHNGTANSQDVAASIAYGVDGNIYAAGVTQNSGTYRDFTVISLTASGDTNWVYLYDGQGGVYSGDDEAYAVACGTDGNIYAAGYSYVPGNDWDYTVISIDNTGSANWVFRSDGSGNSYDCARDVVFGMNDNVYTAGYRSSMWWSAEFTMLGLDSTGYVIAYFTNSGPRIARSLIYGSDGRIYIAGTRDDYGNDDMMVKKQNPYGGYTFFHCAYDGPAHGDDEALDIAYGTDSVYVAGYSTGIQSGEDFTVLAIDLSGTIGWVYRHPSEVSSEDRANTIVVSCLGDIIAAGYCTHKNTKDALVISLDISGDTNWVYRYATPMDDVIQTLAYDGLTRLYAAGWSSGDFVVISLGTTGVEEQPIAKPVETHENLTATIFRGPLQLPESKKCKVYDISGRVVEPSKIQPGIYFIEVDGVVTQKVVKVR
jgi:hypothetical protein